VGVQSKDICQLLVTKKDIIGCIDKARNIDFIDNLRERHPNVKFDSKLRGYIGEAAFKNWLSLFNIIPTRINSFNAMTNMDVDMVLMRNNQELKVELKTSLIPDVDKTMDKVIHNRDIKLIKRGSKNILELEHDIHIQILFRQKSKAKDEWIKQQPLNLDNDDLDALYYKSGAYRYITDTFFIAWVDKESLNKIHYPKEQTWGFKNSKRTFWKCSIAEQSHKPMNLIDYLKS
jgi:hypothetical protein